MIRLLSITILLLSQVVLFAQNDTKVSINHIPNKIFIQTGYFEDNSFRKVNGFKTMRIGYIKSHSVNRYWGYNLNYLDGKNSFMDSAMVLIIDSSGIRIDTIEVTIQEKLSLLGLDVSHYRDFFTKGRFTLGLEYSAGFSYRRRKKVELFEVNIRDYSLSLNAHLFSLYKLNDRIDIYMDLNLLQFDFGVRNNQFIDGNTQRNDGTFQYEELDVLGKSINRVYMGITYSF